MKTYSPKEPTASPARGDEGKPTTVQSRWAAILFPSPRWALASLLVITVAAYLGVFVAGELTGRSAQSGQVHFSYLAESFLEGRLDVNPDRNPELIELVPYEGKWYVPYPPMPALLALPLVAAFGPDFPTALVSIALAVAAVGLMFLWVRALGVGLSAAWWSGLLFALGSGFWYSAVKGSSWQLAHVVGIFFFTAALLEARTGGRGWLAGLLLGAALWSRLPMVLASPVLAYFLWERHREHGDRFLRAGGHVAAAAAGVGLFIALNALYNQLRFDTFANVAYEWIPGVLEEPWYNHGILSFSYLPRSLFFALLRPPAFTGEFPYLIPDAKGLSVLLLTPAYFLLFRVNPRSLRVWVMLLGVLLCIGPGLLHGWPGGTQLGYRFSLDAAPLLVGLIALAMARRWTRIIPGLVLLSILLNVWGLLFLQSVNEGLHWWPAFP
jgi:hypothetical protein